MNWQLLLLISIVLSAVSTILQRYVLKDQDSKPHSFAIIFQFLNGFLILLFGIVTNQISFSGVIDVWPSLLLMTLLYGLGILFNYSALKYTEASEYAILSTGKVFITVIASTVFLHEALNRQQSFGALLIVAAVVLVTFKKTKLSFKKGEMLTLLMAFFFGLAVTNDKSLLTSLNVYAYVFLVFVTPTFILMLANPKAVVELPFYLQKKRFPRILLVSAIHTLVAITFFAALQLSTNSSQIVIINLLGIILTVILSIVFLKEKDYLARKIIAVVLSFLGLLLVS